MTCVDTLNTGTMYVVITDFHMLELNLNLTQGMVLNQYIERRIVS
jgi:hypothetical protein